MRAFVVTLAATMIAAATGYGALAQAPASKPAPKAAPKAQQKSSPAPEAAQPPQQQAEAPYIYLPWTKFCLKGQEANAKQVCFTGKEARIESGQPVVSAVLIEPEGEPRKLLRVTLPLGVALQYGTRVIIDQGTPMTGPFVICFANGCMADYEATGELISTLKKGQQLTVQAFNGGNGQNINVVLPLNDFAKAYDGPPTDPKVFEEQQRKLQDDLQRRAEEARRKLESQQQQAPTR